jgi:hypothetical protein
MSDIDVESARHAFFGRDPVAGDDALAWLLKSFGDRALSQVITVPLKTGGNSVQVTLRLAKLASAVGAAGVPHLIETMRSRDWGASGLAAHAFAGLHGNAQAEQGLIEILEQGNDIDSQRHAIDALGYLGAHQWAFSLYEFAQFQTWGASVEYRRPSDYLLAKLGPYVFDALLRMTLRLNDKDRIRDVMDTFKRLRLVCREVLHRELPGSWDVQFAAHHFGATAADPLQKEWIVSDDPFLQECAFIILSHLRLDRTVGAMIDSADAVHLQPAVRNAASVCLSNFCSRSAATQLARRVSSGPANGLQWAFSTLYAIDVPWPDCDYLIDETLASEGEPKAQLLYALACRRDERAREVEDRLNAKEDHVRGASALSLARLDPTAARDLLSGREDEAASPIERAKLLAAQVHVGLIDRVDQLHSALQEVGMFAYLRPIWKREILLAFFVAEGPESRRGKLWCEAALETDTRLKSEIASLFRQPPTVAPSSVSMSLSTHPPPSPSPSPSHATPYLKDGAATEPSHRYDLFISHASEDKEAVARPLYNALNAAGLRVWFDEATLKLGDSLRRKIDEGLAHCRFGVVILSPRFLAKEWPQRELDGLTARETLTGKKAILPVWHEVDAATVIRYSPPLADRLACRTSEGIEAVALKIKDVLQG